MYLKRTRPSITLTPEESEGFDARVSVDPGGSGCLLWTGAMTGTGYGSFFVNGKGYRAHRLSWERANGPIPQGLELDHLCRVRRCVNPGHLEVVDGRTNILRGESFAAVNAKKTHCKRGHELTPENARITRGRRECRICHAEKCRKRREAKPAEWHEKEKARLRASRARRKMPAAREGEP